MKSLKSRHRFRSRLLSCDPALARALDMLRERVEPASIFARFRIEAARRCLRDAVMRLEADELAIALVEARAGALLLEEAATALKEAGLDSLLAALPSPASVQ